MATTQLYRCDLNTFSLYQQCCSSTEAVQLSGKIYIFQLHWGHIFGSNPGELLLYCMTHFSLHRTILKEKWKEFQKYQKEIKHGTITVHSVRTLHIGFLLKWFILSFSFYSPKPIAVVLHRYHYAKSNHILYM